MEGRKLADFVVKAIKEKKGEDIAVINVKKMTVLTDYFVICTSLVAEHGRTIADEIEKRLKEKDKKITKIDRGSSDSWIALDVGSVIVHIMTEEKRKFYSLEKLWQELEPIMSKQKKSN